MRLRTLERQYGPDLRLEHRAFPLRPAPDPTVRFHGTYREAAWRRCAEAALGDGLIYTPWPWRDHYPNWSLPALEGAKCAARQGPEIFQRVHLALFDALFSRSENIAEPDTVVRVASRAGADPVRFAKDYRAGRGREALVQDLTAAVADGVSTVPTVLVPSTGRALVGLAEPAAYRALIEDALHRRAWVRQRAGRRGENAPGTPVEGR